MSRNTRLRSNVCTVFDVFCEVGISGDGAVVLQKYPEDFTDEATLKSICQFSFPCPQEGDVSEAVQLFSFVLTDSQSQYTYGYCRFTPRNNTCILMMTGFPWHNVFYKILNHVSVVMNTGTQEDVDGLLTRIYHTDIPNVGEKMHFEALNGQHPMDVDIPDLNKLPTLREDKYMLEFFNAISQRQMIAIYASLLKERRIIFTGRKLSQLCSCIHAASTLIFPMHWQFLFIPVLPHTLKDMLQAPMPFMIGVPKQVVNTNEIKELGDVMIVDLEDKTLQGSHDDTAELPPDILSFLKNNLKSAVDMGDSLSRTFLRANVQLFGGYRLGFVRNEETGVISWDKDKFVSEQRTSHQSFLNSLLGSDGVQYLERFIEERMKALNLGLPVTDEFEREINNFDNKYRTQAVNQETLQQAVASVKENANDMIGAIKDKVTSIQIRDKLGKLTPKEIRKASVRKVQMKKQSRTSGIEPLSFENVQWSEEACASSGDSRDTSPNPEQNGTNGEVAVGDLIDLGDESVEVNPLADLYPVLPSVAPQYPPIPVPRTNPPTPMVPIRASPTVVQPPPVPSRRPPIPQSKPVSTAFPSSSNNPFAPVSSTQHSLTPSNSGVFVNPFYNPTVASQPSQPSHSWEKFE